MDALIFMMIASGAATLLLFVSGLYASSTNGQIMTIYNYEYGGNALIAIHYAKDSDGKWFWNELKNKLLGQSAESEVKDYLSSSGGAADIWSKVLESSPAQTTLLCFEGASFLDKCYPSENDAPESNMIYSSSVKITPDIDVLIKLYY